MANPTLFASATSRTPRADAVNEAGGRAYALPAKHALAQLAATGTFNQTFYVSGGEQLDRVRDLAKQVDDRFLARLAVYARERGFLKDMPAALLTVLSTRDAALTHRVFPRVVDNGRMLRTVFQMVRSGQFGRRGLSSSLKRAFAEWINAASPSKLLSASVGGNPSLRDVMRMARPRPASEERRALYGFLTDKPYAETALPDSVRALLKFRRAKSDAEQAALVAATGARWDLLADAALGPRTWAKIAAEMGPQALRMNLNTLMRHGVLKTASDARRVAERLRDADAVRRSRQMPFQYFAAYKAASDVPDAVRQALHAAAETACESVPEFPGPVVIGVDVSGSMSMPVTGYRGAGTTKVRCVDAAAVFAAAVLRKNPDSVVIPFDHRAHEASVDPGDTLLSVADRLAAFGGGATDCSLPIRAAVERFPRRRFAGVVLVSDNESWVDTRGAASMTPGYLRAMFGASAPNGFARGATGVMAAWREFVKHQLRIGGESANPKLVCIDIQPGRTTQAPERPDVLNVGGFSDAVFAVTAAFLRGDSGRFVREVEATEL